MNKTSTSYSISFMLLLFVTITAKASEPLDKSNFAKSKNLLFLENRGQICDDKGNARPDILYTSEGNGVKMFITKTGIFYQFSKIENPEALKLFDKFHPAEMDIKQEEIKTTTYRLEMHLKGANKNAEVVSENENPYFENYYNVLSHPEGITHVRSFEKVNIKNVYPNIDWVLYITEGKLKYDFVVNPGGIVSDIKIKYEGAEKLNLKPDGSIDIHTPMGKINEGIPYSYQANMEDTKTVSSKFVKLDNGILGFNVGDYNGQNLLVIDPSIVWATYYGGSTNDFSQSCTNDLAGNVYMAGYTQSTNNISSGGFQDSLLGNYDAFLVKFASNGIRLWATYYGGSGDEQGQSCSANSTGNIYLAGYTNSVSGIASGGYQNIYGGGPSDAFVVKFDSAGNRVWATYYGGIDRDEGLYSSIDAVSNVYLTGGTASVDSIAFAGFQNIYGGGVSDAFLVKFDSSGNRLWATYYGGPNHDDSRSCISDVLGNVYITGYTQSLNNIASGGFQNVNGGNGDAFLTKFDSNGAQLWATYYGGSSNDYGTSCSADAAGRVYLAGWTGSQNDIASGGFQNVFGGVYDAFLVKFESNGNRLWATYYGGNDVDYGYSCSSDASGNVFLTGNTQSQSGISFGGFQNTIGGGDAAYIVNFDNNGNRLWASYFGGNNNDVAASCITDTFGNVYVAGFTLSPSGVSSGGFQNTFGGGVDAFLVKIGTQTGLDNFLIDKDEFNIYPNPTNGLVQLDFIANASGITDIIVLDLIGRVQNKEQRMLTVGQNKINLDISALSKGVYIVQLNNGQNKITRKVVLN